MRIWVGYTLRQRVRIRRSAESVEPRFRIEAVDPFQVDGFFFLLTTLRAVPAFRHPRPTSWAPPGNGTLRENDFQAVRRVSVTSDSSEGGGPLPSLHHFRPLPTRQCYDSSPNHL
jgi:hypothetical protein